MQSMNTNKPECELSNIDGNVFSIIGAVARALKEAGFKEEALEWRTKALACTSYDDVLTLAYSYVDVV